MPKPTLDLEVGLDLHLEGALGGRYFFIALLETNILAPEAMDGNGRQIQFPFGGRLGLFSGAFAVSFREGTPATLVPVAFQYENHFTWKANQ